MQFLRFAFGYSKKFSACEPLLTLFNPLRQLCRLNFGSRNFSFSLPLRHFLPYINSKAFDFFRFRYFYAYVSHCANYRTLFSAQNAYRVFGVLFVKTALTTLSLRSVQSLHIRPFALQLPAVCRSICSDSSGNFPSASAASSPSLFLRFKNPLLGPFCRLRFRQNSAQIRRCKFFFPRIESSFDRRGKHFRSAV